MSELSDFRLGSDVFTSDGDSAGTLASVLVEKDGFEPKALVVEISLEGLLSDEKLFVHNQLVIPIDSVGSATHDRIELNLSTYELGQHPPYLAYRWHTPSAGATVLEEAQLLGGGLGMPSAEEVANKPPDQLEIDRDEKVMLGTTGRTLGKVHDLLYAQSKLVGVVIRPGGFFKRDVVLPARYISRADDLALFADLTEADVKMLKPFGAEP